MEWINLLNTAHSRAFDMPWLAYFAWWTEKLAKQTSDGALGESEYGTRNHLNSIIAVLANISTGKKLNSQFVKSKYLRPRRLLNTLLRKLAFPPGNEACLISSPILFILFHSVFNFYRLGCKKGQVLSGQALDWTKRHQCCPDCCETSPA